MALKDPWSVQVRAPVPYSFSSLAKASGVEAESREFWWQCGVEKLGNLGIFVVLFQDAVPNIMGI